MTRLLLVPSVLEAERLLPEPRELPTGTELLVCGVGLLAAGLAAAARLARGDVRDAMLIGLAGTRDPALAPVGALVAGMAVRNEAFGAGHGSTFLGLGAMGLRREPLDPELMALTVPAALEASGGTEPSGSAPHHVVHGVFGSVAAASGSPADAAAWHARHPDVLAEEMEAYAVSIACARARVPLACIRAISNVAGQRDVARWDLGGACGVLRAVLPALLASPTLALPRGPRVPA